MHLHTCQCAPLGKVSGVRLLSACAGCTSVAAAWQAPLRLACLLVAGCCTALVEASWLSERARLSLQRRLAEGSCWCCAAACGPLEAMPGTSSSPRKVPMVIRPEH